MRPPSRPHGSPSDAKHRPFSERCEASSGDGARAPPHHEGLVTQLRLEIPGDVDMDIRAPDQRYNPYRIFSREQWAELRNDTPMTLEPGEFSRLRSLHDRPDPQEGRGIYLPPSRPFCIFFSAPT